MPCPTPGRTRDDGAEIGLPRGGRFTCDSGVQRVKFSPRKVRLRRHHHEITGCVRKQQTYKQRRLPNVGVLLGERKKPSTGEKSDGDASLLLTGLSPDSQIERVRTARLGCCG